MDAVLDVGHGRRPDGVMDYGTVGKDRRREHDEAHEVALFANQALTRSGVKFSTDDHGSGGHHDPNWSGSVRRANDLRVKCAVEVHWDANLGQNDGGFGLHHRGSSQGQRLARTIAARYKQFGLNVRFSDGAITPQDIGRGDLGFLANTNMPAVIWECGVIKDVARDVNEQMGEAIAAGICDWLDVTYIQSREDTPRWAVVVSYEDDRTEDDTSGEGWDSACAHMLGKDNLFRVVPASKLRNGEETAQWVVSVGFNADQIKNLGADGGVEVAGGDRIKTMLDVLALVNGPEPTRTYAWR